MRRFFRNLTVILALSSRQAWSRSSIYVPATGTVTKKRRPIHLHVMVSEEELALIRERMAQAKGPGYERWAKVYNLKQVAAALSISGDTI